MTKKIQIILWTIVVAFGLTSYVEASSFPNENTGITNNTFGIQLNQQVPMNTPLFMEGKNPTGESVGFLNLTPYVGWDYPSIGGFNGRQEVMFEQSRNGVIIRALNPRSANYNYFNISNRGYIYLDRRENAKEFHILNNFSGNTVNLQEIQSRQNVGTYHSRGVEYLTIGANTKPTNFRFFERKETLVTDGFQNFNSSFFFPIIYPWTAQPTMNNGQLSLPTHSTVGSNSLLFERNSSYLITLGNLRGNVRIEFVDIESGLVFQIERLSSNGTDASIFYTHSQPYNWSHQTSIRITSDTNTTLQSFKLEKLA